MVRTKRAAFKAAKTQVAAHSGTAKKGGQQNAAQSKSAAKAVFKAQRLEKNERRQKKLAKRKVQKPQHAPGMWDIPAPANLVATLDQPKVKSKYQSYFEFAENTEKKDKKLEFQVTNDPNPPPGFTFIPFGDPDMTNYCKELSRERGAMIFIVSGSKEDQDKINVHMHRTGYHFRESIVEEARESLGDAVLHHPTYAPGTIEPIPDTQEEINKQADAAIKDLFPRIPNTDRQMILDHAFRKGGLFHGEPVVGLTPDLPLSRRVQLAVLAHIRHTHTRYDKLLRETTWANARKVVEPVCLDVLIKWRGDEETGRDQMDEILREVVIITDSEDEDEDETSSGDDSSDEGQVSSASTEVEEISSQPNLRNLPRTIPTQTGRPVPMQISSAQGSNAPHPHPPEDISSRTRSRLKPKAQVVRKAHRHGFKRYQAAYDEALHRQQGPSTQFAQHQSGSTPSLRQPLYASPNGFSGGPDYSNLDLRRRDERPVTQQDPYYSQYRQQQRPPPGGIQQRHEVTVRPESNPPINQGMQPSYGAPSNPYEDERPSQVVKGSTQRHGLQDMLAISIENSSSDATRPLKYPEVERNGDENFVRRQDSHPRTALDARRYSPLGRQVIVIDDDSPQSKRRRVHEDDSGRFRPLPSRDYSPLAAPADSHMLRSSSAQSRYPSTRPPMARTEVEGFSSSAGSYATARPGIPIYDVPEAGYTGRPPEQFRRSEVYDPRPLNSRTVIQHEAPIRLSTTYASEPVYRRSAHQDRTELSGMRLNEDPGFRQVGPKYSDSYSRRPQSPTFPVPASVSRSYDVGLSRDVVDQGLIQNFSQSRLNSSVQPRAGVIVLPQETSRQIPPTSTQGQSYSHQDHGARSFSALPQRRSRSPPRYIERSIYEREGRHLPIAYGEERQPIQYQAPANEPPIFVREITARPVTQYPLPAYPTRQQSSRRPVIVLE